MADSNNVEPNSTQFFAPLDDTEGLHQAQGSPGAGELVAAAALSTQNFNPADSPRSPREDVNTSGDFAAGATQYFDEPRSPEAVASSADELNSSGGNLCDGDVTGTQAFGCAPGPSASDQSHSIDQVPLPNTCLGLPQEPEPKSPQIDQSAFNEPNIDATQNFDNATQAFGSGLPEGVNLQNGGELADCPASPAQQPQSPDAGADLSFDNPTEISEPQSPDAGLGQPQSPEPESGLPQSPEPESAQPQSPTPGPESAQPRSPEPESEQPQSPEPVSEQPQSPEPESGHPRSPEPVSGQPGSPEPDSGQPQSPEPESETEQSHRKNNLDAPKSPEPDLEQPDSPDPEKGGSGDEKSGSDSDDALPPEAVESMLNEDDSDAENAPENAAEKATEETEATAPPEDVDNLIADIFGESDNENEDKEGNEGAAGSEPKRDSSERETSPLMDRAPIEYDFDVIMREKAEERKRGAKRRKRTGGGTVDLINDSDGLVQEFISKMRAAAQEDRRCNEERRPALNKRKMLPVVVATCKKADLGEILLDNGLLSSFSEWLAPLPDKGLPALEIRVELLKLLETMPRVESGMIKNSGIGKAVMLLSKHPREDSQNRLRAKRIIGEWARPIFNLDEQLSREDREERDQKYLPAKRQRVSTDAEPTENEGLRPGDKGFIVRARVPQPSKRDYVIRPKSNVEGEFKMSSKRKSSRYDVKYREFQGRNKASKAERAVTVSLVGKEGKM